MEESVVVEVGSDVVVKGSTLVFIGSAVVVEDYVVDVETRDVVVTRSVVMW